MAATVLSMEQVSATSARTRSDALERAPGQNDAASGQDAGDAPAAALLLSAGPRDWKANLTPPGSDRDWYRASATGAFCAVANAVTHATGTVMLGANEDLGTQVSRVVDPRVPVRLALASPSGDVPFLGILPAPTVTTTSFGTDTDDGHGPGRYDFSLDVKGYGDLDPEGDGEGIDAGATIATSAPLAQDCGAGRLDRAAGDSEDRYHLDVTEAGDLTISFAVASGAGAQARILDPTGAVVATVASGDVATVWTGQLGRWQVVVGDPTSSPTRAVGGLSLAPLSLDRTDYILGAIGPGDSQPCRPSC